MRHADIVVVGGGPAGAAAAITAARAGRDVVVVDKATFPRDKCCGDGLTAAALRHLEALGLDPASVPSWTVVDDAWVRSPSGRTTRFPLPRDAGQFMAVARREELDAAVLQLARDAGAEVRDGHGLEAARRQHDGIVVDVEGIGPIHGRYAIGADGIWSPLRKALGAAEPGYLGEWHAFRQYFRDVGPAASRDLFVFFEPDLLPGYAWSFPLGAGRANVGFGIQRGGPISVREMKRRWPDLLSRPHIREVIGEHAIPEAPHRAWPIPARLGDLKLRSGPAVFVGDAAAATDPMTGEGIAQALLTGSLAAGAIVEAGPHRVEEAGRRYEAQVARALGSDARLAKALSRVLRHRKGARAALRLAGVTGATRREFARWLFEDYPRAALLTPRRWGRGGLHGDGAFGTEEPTPVRDAA